MLTLDQIRYDLRAGELERGLDSFVLYAENLPTDAASTAPGGGTPIFFIPDLHLLSPGRAAGYGDFFNISGTRINRLKALLARLLELKEDPGSSGVYGRMQVYQLGDFHDLWREMDHVWGEDVGEMLKRQAAAYGDLFGLCRRLGMVRLVGNHDKKLRDAGVRRAIGSDPVTGKPFDEAVIPDTTSIRWGSYQRIDLMHADQIDDTETGFFSFINPAGARTAGTIESIGFEIADEWSHEVLPPGTPDPAPPDVELNERVFFADRYEETDDKRLRFFHDTWTHFQNGPDVLKRRGRDRLLTVIGHTHFPRIVVDPNANRVRYSMADCGSWVNFTAADSNHGGPRFWNSQIGILTGNQIGIVQIGHDPA